MRELSQYMAEREKKREDTKYTLIGYMLAPFIAGVFFVWYNHVLTQWNIGYWQFVAISIPVALAPKWLRVPIMGTIGSAALFCQVAYWVGLITSLPVIKP